MIDQEKLIQYIYEEFPSVFNSSSYCREWLENTIQWIAETYEADNDRIKATICSILPEIEEDELTPFFN